MASQHIIKDHDGSRGLERTERTEPRQLTPAVDIYENAAEYLLFADLPGVEPGAVNVELEANELSIEAKLPRDNGFSAVYKRTFQVGPGIDPAGISAELKHGVLKLTARKSEAVRPRQISVKAG